jgi:hypothetical protein
MMTPDAVVDRALGRANPYVGPRPIRLGEKIYGRDRELDEIRENLTAERIVLLYSPSGAGKSSLLEAGLRDALGKHEFKVLPTIRVGLAAEPGPDSGRTSNRYMRSALLSLEEGRPEGSKLSESDLRAITLDDYLARLEEESSRDNLETCLLFDQFEELFTLDPTDQDDKRAFIEDVGVALRNRTRWALFAMREDFIAQLDPYLSLIPTKFSARYRLDLLGVAAAKAAARRPAADLGVDFSEAAADRLVDDLRRTRVQRGSLVTEELGPYVEPVQLQVVCRQLWTSMGFT